MAVQVLSGCPSFPAHRFGTEPRLEHDGGSPPKPTPGPGAYVTPGAVGKQAVSRKVVCAAVRDARGDQPYVHMRRRPRRSLASGRRLGTRAANVRVLLRLMPCRVRLMRARARAACCASAVYLGLKG